MSTLAAPARRDPVDPSRTGPGVHLSVPSAAGPLVVRSGFILWFTGLSGAGKSTLARAVQARFGEASRLEILDGDEVRAHLSKGLGFGREDRDTNVRRIGFVARLLARHGVGAIAAAISPYAEVRAEVRREAEAEGIAFVEVYVSAPIEVLAARDVKGLYRQALAGELPNFTGVSDPYEPPSAPDIVVLSDRERVEEGIERIVRLLAGRRLVAPALAEEVA